jgi:septal ring factor EnvC (AmiA/AmiB activator)
MSENTVDIYAKAVATGKDVNFNVAFDLGGIFLSSKTHKDKYLVAEKMIKEFATKMTKEPLLDKLKEAQKILAKGEDEQKNLEKDNARLNEEIQNYKNKIKTAEDNLAKNKTDQEKKKAEIETNKKLVVEIETKLKATE